MNRASMARAFASSTQSRSPWKTFVLEAHAHGDPDGLLTDVFGSAQVRATDDVHLHEVNADSARFWVDHLDGRFWSVHTEAPVSMAAPLLKDAVESRRDLDWMWLPSDHLRDVWPDTQPQWLATDFTGRRLTHESDNDVSDLNLRVRGGPAAAVLRLIEGSYGRAVSFSEIALGAHDEDLGSIKEAVNRSGRFVAQGDFPFHQAIVRRVVERYRGFVESAEASALRLTVMENGSAQLTGAPIVLRFSRPIPDVEFFLEHLFSAREPFRLWGVPEMTGEDTATVEAVDLHVGQQLRFDVTPDWLRVYLFAGGCGNTVARLAANLQHHFDGALSIVDPELDARLSEPSAA